MRIPCTTAVAAADACFAVGTLPGSTGTNTRSPVAGSRAMVPGARPTAAAAACAAFCASCDICCAWPADWARATAGGRGTPSLPAAPCGTSFASR